MAEKLELEAVGLAKLKTDFKVLPKFIELVSSYEAQEVPEARFVRVLDKCMPHVLHFQDGGTALRLGFTKKALLANSRNRAAALRHDYPEYEELIRLLEELSERMAELFLSN